MTWQLELTLKLDEDQNTVVSGDLTEKELEAALQLASTILKRWASDK